MEKEEKPRYKIAKYDRAKGCDCECECELPVTVVVTYSGRVKAPKDLATLKAETPDITIISG